MAIHEDETQIQGPLQAALAKAAGVKVVHGDMNQAGSTPFVGQSAPTVTLDKLRINELEQQLSRMTSERNEREGRAAERFTSAQREWQQQVDAANAQAAAAKAEREQAEAALAAQKAEAQARGAEAAKSAAKKETMTYVKIATAAAAGLAFGVGIMSALRR
jgi:hypothetical protein